MPCKQCEDGKWRWGETGDCNYDTLDECERANEGEARVKTTAFDLISKQAWAIMPDALNTICSIARRENASVEAVEAQMGEPLMNAREVTMRGSTAIIPVTGPIFRYANLFTRISGATSIQDLALDFNAALDDQEVSNIILVLDSPGGMVSGVAEMAAMIHSSHKPVTAYVDNMAASAGYWLAAAADTIVVSKTATVGNIGAVLTVGASKDDGSIEFVSTQSPNKRPDVTTESGAAQIQSYVDAVAQVFIEDVALYRNMTPEAVIEDFGKGAISLGENAVTVGLADRVGTLEELIAGASGVNEGGLFMSNTQGTPDAAMPVINREYLMANHADLVRAFMSEGHVEGANAERTRIQTVFNTPLAANHKDLLVAMMFDGETDGATAALKVLEAEQIKGSSVSNDLEADAGDLDGIETGASASGDGVVPQTNEQKWEANWAKDADLRAEFGDSKNAYMAYMQANANGQIKILGGDK